MEAGVESVEGVTGGDKGSGHTVGGQQRASLLGGEGVVDDHQDPLMVFGVGGQHTAIQPLPVLQTVGYVIAGHAQCAQQAFQGPLGRQAALGVVAGQVGEEHPAGEPARLLAGPGGGLDGQFGLADAGQTGHGGHQHCLPGARAAFVWGQHVQQPLDVLVAAGEGGRGGGHPGQGRGDLRRQLHGDVPALDDRVEEDPAADRVGDSVIRCALVGCLCLPHAGQPRTGGRVLSP